MPVFNRRVLTTAAFAALIMLPFAEVAAQAFPDKPLRLILPFPPGGPSDIQGRALADQLSKQLNVNVLPDNRPGAGGNFGLEIASQSPADGYHIVLSSPSVAISPSLYKSLNYNAERDLTPVARMTSIENVMVVHPSVPARSIREFVTLARNHRGEINFGSGGAGTTNHLANEMFQHYAKIKMLHVPYKGATRAALALIGGEVDEVVVSVPSVMPYIKSGRVRPIAVLSRERVPQLPQVPTAIESGYKDFTISIWYGIFAPAGTPQNVLARLNQEITTALKSPELSGRLSTLGIQPWPGTQQELATLVSSEKVRFAELIRIAGIKKR
ncbi:MAG: tripartite tricarboxylate transporter substrate binding protein [Betaproteobacteria bacterium]|jgi:tripartite-type tricarboxylate transporter receptor subunit TctC|nr:tripartite tricarboxylate transporter substrate binding protein [Betaproteobacteria bacterium]MDH4292623.1 tripartite tricarboxylate transporter substrate binding protein [Betaproteobacteria bacterium]MDH5342527.1 tripartite tricarboxylate transporter substrate binding protein [Betaproteobacteria bacterium]